MKLRGLTLYKEGSKANGVWLIFNGVVKWPSKSARNKHLLHPNFKHGSTLGLYEVLVGKPYICSMITDSVVLCFFIKTDKILSVLRSDPAIEDFLWQESAIVLAKILLPHIYENMAMQELRALVAERSLMTIYIRGETVEIPQHSIGFLLEGFVKLQGVQEELVTSPAALLPSHGNLSFQNSETSGAKAASFSRLGSTYHVETRARVIILGMATFEAETTLQRRPSSFILHSADHLPKFPSREHAGLMSFPEYLFNSRQHDNKPEELHRQANSLSARAMQLNKFGSMDDTQKHSRSFPRNVRVNPLHSLSYPRIPLNQGRPLVSVKSEGECSTGKSLTALPPRSTIKRLSHSSHAIEDSSEDSGVEDELIVRIDSPSNLSFRQAL